MLKQAWTFSLLIFCGKRGIRTPGPSQVNGFQDRRVRPLRHLSIALSFKSGCKSTAFFLRDQIFEQKSAKIMQKTGILSSSDIILPQEQIVLHCTDSCLLSRRGTRQ